VAVDGVLYLSGEIGTGPDGKLVQGFDAQVRQTMDNIVATLARGRSHHGRCVQMHRLSCRHEPVERVQPDISVLLQARPAPGPGALGVNGLAMGAVTEVECWATFRGK
jgi:enamine deaminase RidA (YjgF/YER057c/UK114 family)